MKRLSIPLSPREQDSSVKLMTVLVVLGLISMEEFHSVMVGLQEAYLVEDFLSEAFIERLSEYYRDLLV